MIREGSIVLCPQCGTKGHLHQERNPLDRTERVDCLVCKKQYLVDYQADSVLLQPLPTGVSEETMEAPKETKRPSRKEKAWQSLTAMKPSADYPWHALVGHITAATLNCIDQHLQRRHALDITKAFIKYAHGDHTTSNRAHFRELYKEFAQWIEDS